MPYIVLADIVVVIHLMWIVFLFIGAWWGRRYFAVGIVHVSGLLFALLIQITGWYCPLTTLEYALREHGFGETGSSAGLYAGSFIAHYARKIVYLDVSRGFVFAATLLLIGVNAWFYLRRPRRP